MPGSPLYSELPSPAFARDSESKGRCQTSILQRLRQAPPSIPLSLSLEELLIRDGLGDLLFTPKEGKVDKRDVRSTVTVHHHPLPDSLSNSHVSSSAADSITLSDSDIDKPRLPRLQTSGLSIVYTEEPPTTHCMSNNSDPKTSPVLKTMPTKEDNVGIVIDNPVVSATLSNKPKTNVTYYGRVFSDSLNRDESPTLVNSSKLAEGSQLGHDDAEDWIEVPSTSYVSVKA